MELTLKEIHRYETNASGTDIVELGANDSPHDFIDKAVIYSMTCKNIFVGKKNWGKLKVLKITYPENNRKIWREMCTYGITGVNKEVVAMPYNSLWELGFMDKKEHKVEVEPGRWWPFYWNHPVHATRISFRLGAPALIISLISLIISLI